MGFDAIETSDSFVRVRDGYMGRWSREISVCLQRANAKMIIHGRSAGLDLGPAGFLNMDYADDFQDMS